MDRGTIWRVWLPLAAGLLALGIIFQSRLGSRSLIRWIMPCWCSEPLATRESGHSDDLGFQNASRQGHRNSQGTIHQDAGICAGHSHSRVWLR